MRAARRTAAIASSLRLVADETARDGDSARSAGAVSGDGGWGYAADASSRCGTAASCDEGWGAVLPLISAGRSLGLRSGAWPVPGALPPRGARVPLRPGAGAVVALACLFSCDEGRGSSLPLLSAGWFPEVSSGVVLGLGLLPGASGVPGAPSSCEVRAPSACGAGAAALPACARPLCSSRSPKGRPESARVIRGRNAPAGRCSPVGVARPGCPETCSASSACAFCVACGSCPVRVSCQACVS